GYAAGSPRSSRRSSPVAGARRGPTPRVPLVQCRLSQSSAEMTTRARRCARWTCALACAGVFAASPAWAAQPPAAESAAPRSSPVPPGSLADFSLEELRDVVVVSVSRRRQLLLE